MLTNQSPSRRRALGFAGGLLGAVALSGRAVAGPASPSQVNVPISDGRNIEPNAVRFAAVQATRESQAVLLLGGDKVVLQKVISAVQQSIFDGYPVKGIFVGSADAPPALEIYATGILASKPIDPRTITKERLVALLRDIHREFYR